MNLGILSGMTRGKHRDGNGSWAETQDKGNYGIEEFEKLK
jgi:hypothetical protein